MSLYALLASSYDELFPIAPDAAPFLDALAGRAGRRAEGLRALDAGCATGAHALALAALGWTALGLDSEAAMISVARAAALKAGLSERAAFVEASILDLRRQAAKGSFDLILCLGNTLPHLLGGGAESFLAQARESLRPDGALVLQILNFALPGMGAGYAFPALDAYGVAMRRRYEAPPPGMPDALRFVAELTKEGRTASAETLLRPLPPSSLASLLAEAGFSPPALFSGWDGGLFDEGRDPYLLAVARPASPASLEAGGSGGRGEPRPSSG
jgi:glycine/sarcosine N-methyltransferase